MRNEGTWGSADWRIDCLLIHVETNQAPQTPEPSSPAPDISPGEILTHVPKEKCLKVAVAHLFGSWTQSCCLSLQGRRAGQGGCRTHSILGGTMTWIDANKDQGRE